MLALAGKQFSQLVSIARRVSDTSPHLQVNAFGEPDSRSPNPHPKRNDSVAQFDPLVLPKSTTTSPTTRCGIATGNKGSLIPSTTLPVPKCSPRGVLVKVHAVALNPVDVKMPPAIGKEGLIAGNDFAGEITEIGSEVHMVNRPGCAPWIVGDRVCGAVLGCNPKKPASGSFAELIEADPVTMTRVPEHWRWEEGAALGGCCVGAVGLALFQNLGLKLPGKGDVVVECAVAADYRNVVLVYGGSTACGTVALQLLKLYVPLHIIAASGLHLT